MSGDRIRVIVVVDVKKALVHGVTCDNAEAVGWVDQITRMYADHSMARVYVGTVSPPEVAS